MPKMAKNVIFQGRPVILQGTQIHLLRVTTSENRGPKPENRKNHCFSRWSKWLKSRLEKSGEGGFKITILKSRKKGQNPEIWVRVG